MAADNSRTGPEASAGIHLKFEVSCNSILCGDHREPTSYMFCSILESAVLRLENYVQVDALVVVDFTMLYVVARQLLLSSRVSSLVINLLTINLSFRDGPL